MPNLQFSISRIFIIVLFITISGFIFSNFNLVKSRYKSFIFSKSSPYSLALFRIFLFYNATKWYREYGITKIFWFESTDKASLPYMGWFIHSFDLTVSQYQFICTIGIISATFIIFGLFTRWMLILHAIVCFLIIASPNFYGKLSHNQILIWIPWILTFSRCYDVWSLDALWKKYKGKKYDTSPKSDYGIPIKIIWLHFGIIYFFAGVYKLWHAGFDWALSDSMLNQILTEWVQHYDWKPEIRVDHYPNVVKLGGLFVILFELAFPFLLFKFRTRIIAILGGLTLHKSAGYFMKIGFEKLQSLYVFFINWDWIFHKFHLLSRLAKNKFISNDIASNQKEIYFKSILLNKNKAFEPFYGKKALYSGLFILSMNFFCGMFAIHSYPFSAYPSYSSLVKSEINLLHFEGFDKDGVRIDVLEEAQKVNFRREDYTIFENKIIYLWENDSDLEKQILEYWKIWHLKIPKLKEITTLKVYYHKTPLIPERRKEYIINELIYDKKIE
jgi:hypothetical protein